MKNKIRKFDRFVFVAKYFNLCEELFSINISHKGYKSKKGRKLIELARRELKYKETTYSGDIYFQLFRMYRNINNVASNNQ